MLPDAALPSRPSAAVEAHLHSSPALPLAATLEPEAFAHVITELQDPGTKQGRKDTLLALLGLVREADDPADRAKPANAGEGQGRLEVDVERAGEVDVEGTAEEIDQEATEAEGDGWS